MTKLVRNMILFARRKFETYARSSLQAMAARECSVYIVYYIGGLLVLTIPLVVGEEGRHRNISTPLICPALTTTTNTE